MIPIAILPVMFIGRTIRTMSNRAQSRLAEAGAEAAEALDAIELVQAYSREDRRLAAFSDAVEATFAAAMKRITARSFMIVMVSVLLFGGFVCVLWLGARSVAHQMPFETDGVVIKVNDLQQQEELGYTAKSSAEIDTV